MTTFAFYTNGVLNAIPGQPLESDHQDITYLNALGSPLYSSTNVGIANFPVNTNVPFTYQNTTTGQTVSGVVPVGAVASSDAILAALYGIIPRSIAVSFSSVSSNFTFTSTLAGADVFVITVNGTVFANTVAGAAGTTLKVGRILVPVSLNNDLSIPANDSTRRYRYPVVTDTANTLAQAVVSVLSAATNISRYGGRDGQLTILPGSTAPGLLHGLICMYPVTAFSSTSTILVETNTVNDTVGRLTGTPTATTLAMPLGKMFVESGSSLPNLACAIRL